MTLAFDDKGRLRPGSAPGWGYSWWLVAHDVTKADFEAMTPSQRMELWIQYDAALHDGWAPDVTPDEWVGPHHPSAPSRAGQTSPPRTKPKRSRER